MNSYYIYAEFISEKTKLPNRHCRLVISISLGFN